MCFLWLLKSHNFGFLQLNRGEKMNQNDVTANEEGMSDKKQFPSTKCFIAPFNYLTLYCSSY